MGHPGLGLVLGGPEPTLQAVLKLQIAPCCNWGTLLVFTPQRNHFTLIDIELYLPFVCSFTQFGEILFTFLPLWVAWPCPCLPLTPAHFMNKLKRTSSNTHSWRPPLLSPLHTALLFLLLFFSYQSIKVWSRPTHGTNGSQSFSKLPQPLLTDWPSVVLWLWEPCYRLLKEHEAS